MFFSQLGYANAKIYKCNYEKCPRPACFVSGGSGRDDSLPCSRPGCPGRFELVRHVSFVDCPGHDILMATMLNGAAVMDAALLLIGKKKTSLQYTDDLLNVITITYNWSKYEIKFNMSWDECAILQ